MLQIIKNYLFILLLPIIFGFLLRFLLRKTKLDFLPTVIFTVGAVIMWIISTTIDTASNEMFAIWATITTAMAIASLITGLILRFIKNKKK